MNRDLFRDYLSAKVISENKMLDNYTRIYPKANENLVDVYLDLDFEDKDVLSVVSSSDQIFTPKLLGARRVDGFDRNRLTKYYYYLRKWTIKYNREIYPIDLIEGDKNYLLQLLSKVKVSSEEEKDAYTFWMFMYNHVAEINNLFFDDNKNVGETLFDNNVHYLEKLDLKDLDFYNYNFFDDIESDRTYDYIMMSNIIEYCRSNEIKLTYVRDNLYDLLNDNGIVICSHLIHQSSGMDDQELRVFNDCFEYNDYGLDKGYTYIKK